MLEETHHFEASLARASVLGLLGLTGLMAVIAAAAYSWHIYKLIVLDG